MTITRRGIISKLPLVMVLLANPALLVAKEKEKPIKVWWNKYYHAPWETYVLSVELPTKFNGGWGHGSHISRSVHFNELNPEEMHKAIESCIEATSRYWKTQGANQETLAGIVFEAEEKSWDFYLE